MPETIAGAPPRSAIDAFWEVPGATAPPTAPTAVNLWTTLKPVMVWRKQAPWRRWRQLP